MKNFKLLPLLGIILGVGIISLTKSSVATHENIVMENIEALASDENFSGGTECTKTGSIKCHDGSYVKRVIFKLENETYLH